MKLKQLIKKIARPLVCYLLLSCFVTYWLKISAGGCSLPPPGRDNTHFIFSTALNLLLLSLNSALFWVIEISRIFADLVEKTVDYRAVYQEHLLSAGIPLASFLLGTVFCNLAFRNEPEVDLEQSIGKRTLDIPRNLYSYCLPPVARFLREFMLFGLGFLLLTAVQPKLIAAPNALVENLRLFVFSQKLNAHREYRAGSELHLQVADTYNDLREYEKAFAVVDANLNEASPSKNYDNVPMMYRHINLIDRDGSISSKDWLRLTSNADKKLEDICEKAHPTLKPDRRWDYSSNRRDCSNILDAASLLISAYRKHHCLAEADKWVERNNIVARRLCGASSDIILSSNYRGYFGFTDREANVIPAAVLQKQIALLECEPPEKAKDWNEYFRSSRLDDCLKKLGQSDGAFATKSEAQAKIPRAFDIDRTKTLMRNKLWLAEQTKNYTEAREKALYLGRLINQQFNSVSSEAASYYNRAIDLDHKLRLPKETQLQDLLEAAKSNYECGNYKQALQYLAEIQALKTALYGKDYAGKARDLNLQARAYLLDENLQAARELFERALLSEKRPYGDKTKAIAIYLNNLGDISLQLNDFVKSERYYEEALRIDLLAPADLLDIGSDHENLGKLFAIGGRESYSLKEFTIAKNLKSRMLGDSAVEVVNLDDAISIAKTRKILGGVTAGTKAAQPNSASLDSNQQMFNLKERLYKQAIRNTENGEKPDEELINSLNQLAAFYIEHQRFDDAEPYLDRAIKVAPNALCWHKATINNLDKLGDYYLSQKKYAKAQGHYIRAYQIFAPGSWPSPERAARFDKFTKLFLARRELSRAVETSETALVNRRFGNAASSEIEHCRSEYLTLLYNAGIRDQSSNQNTTK